MPPAPDYTRPKKKAALMFMSIVNVSVRVIDIVSFCFDVHGFGSAGIELRSSEGGTEATTADARSFRFRECTAEEAEDAKPQAEYAKPQSDKAEAEPLSTEGTEPRRRLAYKIRSSRDILPCFQAS